MVQLWMPGAERRLEGNGGSMAGGPPRAVWLSLPGRVLPADGDASRGRRHDIRGGHVY